MTATSFVSFQMGWRPPARSMMLNRRMPSATPGARGSLTKKPSSSGPRWRMAAAIARMQDSAFAGCAAETAPQIPHTRLLDLRAGEEGGAGAEQMPADVSETRIVVFRGVAGNL